MAITPARERVRKSRERKRRGVIPVQVEVSTLEIDFLRRRGYGARPAIRYPSARQYRPSWPIWSLRPRWYGRHADLYVSVREILPNYLIMD